MMDDASASEPAAVSHRIQPALIRASAAFSAMRCIRACCAASLVRVVERLSRVTCFAPREPYDTLVS